MKNIILFFIIFFTNNLFAQEEYEREGPTNLPFEIMSQVGSDYEFESNYGILNIFGKIYRDKNPKSGYYYYMPAEYNLAWDEDTKGYGLKILYMENRGSTGDAVITAKLKPNISRKDIELAKKLLEANIKNMPVEGKHGVKQLISMPLSAAPKFDLADLKVYGVNPENMNPSSPTDFLQPLTVKWRTDRVDDLMAAIFNNIGVEGTLTLTPAGSGLPSFPIRVKIKIDDPKTYGQFELEGYNWRSSKWKNTTDYPIEIKYFHVMKMEKENGVERPFIYTWKTGNEGVEVKPNREIKFNSSQVPRFIDGDPNIKKIWLDYSVKDCNSCDKKVREKLRGGTPCNEVQQLNVVILSSVKEFDAEKILLEVRSIQADPNNNRLVNFETIDLLEGKSFMPIGALHIPCGQKANYEYQLTLIKADGSIFESGVWIRENNSKLVIGQNQIKDAIPGLKN